MAEGGANTMIVRTLQQARQGERRVLGLGWESIRLLLKDDDMGFSFHITTIYQGACLEMQYKNHLESVYCMRGKGEIVSIDSGKTHRIEEGTIYILDKHDRHLLKAETEMQMACVFTPPLNGREIHDADGSYPLDAEVVCDKNV